jgi:hypothetical protein
VDSDSDNPDGYLYSAEKPQSAGTGRTRRLEVKVEKVNIGTLIVLALNGRISVKSSE